MPPRGKVKDPHFQKVNQHYVPRFWQKRFADAQGHVYGRYRKEKDPSASKKGVVRKVRVSDTMTSDYTYTVFDSYWRPHDTLENELSKAESRVASTDTLLLNPNTPCDDDLKCFLCWSIALSVCRLPIVMKRSQQRRVELAYAFACVHLMTETEFRSMLHHEYGCQISDNEYKALQGRNPDDLAKTVDLLATMSPQNPVFPEQDSLEGIHGVMPILYEMDLEILFVHGSPFLILGDQPLPVESLASGFDMPMAKNVLVRATTPLGSSPRFVRGDAGSGDVTRSNQWQFENCQELVIGPDPNQLESL